MSVNLSIKAVPEAVAERLRRRAERNHRSLQGELMAIVEQAAWEQDAARPVAMHIAAPARDFPGGRKTIEDLIAERKRQPLHFAADLPRSVDIVRADRDRR